MSAALGLLAACGTTSAQVKPTSAAEPSASVVVTEEDYDRVRADFEALPDDQKERTRLRGALFAYLTRSANEQLEHRHVDEALSEFKKALTLYSPTDLRGKLENAPLLACAQKLEAAIRPRGAHEDVLLTLAVQLSLTGDAATKSRYRDVADWVRLGTSDLGETGRPVGGRARFVDDLESVSRLWPSPFVVSELTQVYLAPKDAVKKGDLREMLSRGPRGSSAFTIMRLYLRVSRPEDGLQLLRKLSPEPTDQVLAPLTSLIERYLSNAGQPADAVSLAMLFAQTADDRDVAVQICRDAALRFARAPEPRVCAGELAKSLNQLGVAIAYYEDARALDPTKRELWMELARLYRQRLFQASSDEDLKVAALEPQLAKVREFYTAAEKQFPGEPLKPSLDGAYLEVGRGYYNGGRPDDAIAYLKRASSPEVGPLALELTGQIYTKKGMLTEAIAAFNEGIGRAGNNGPEQLYFRARLLRLRAEAEDLGTKDEVAAQTRREALAVWEQIEALGLTPEGQAELGVERGKLLYLLGERQEALATFRGVIDIAPDRGATYADELAFLVPRGELEEALDAYHRALGRSEVTDYLKVYCSLWVIDLARRAKQPEDPLALSFLRSSDGGKWFHDLARWATGRQTKDEIEKRATTPGRRAELAFYEGLGAWSAGDKTTATAKWHNVLATDMMAFFEYDMSALFLRIGGPPAKPLAPKVFPKKAAPPGPEKPAAPRPPRRPPNGAI